MKQIGNMIGISLKSYETVSLQCITSEVVRCTAMFLQCRINQNETRNKVFYMKKVTTLLKQSCRFGCLSDILYLALYFYKTRRYEDSLSCLHKTQERMSLPFVMYNYHVNVEMYRHYMERNTLCTKMKRAEVKDIMLLCEYSYIDELVLEQMISEKNSCPSLFIPPLVMLHMLLILNHHRLGNTVRSQQSLQDLQTLLLYHDGTHVPHLPRDISWQILGICQQICGDYSGSLRSYQNSLQQKSLHKLQKATLFRINSLPRDLTF
ncbi:uncharacterized protein LOC134257409 [Saccostrea cucullata]|uniref:uncharacterized protein LOC134257409 n=1 Tax=Saccostrea cuccullata TaxID=36930 RepID=UPI002ED50947